MNKKQEIKNRKDLINKGEVPEGYKRDHGYTVPINWQITRFNKLFDRITQKNNIKCDNVLTISAQYGLINQQEFFKKNIASTDTSTYFLLHKGDFAYNKSYSTGYPFGTIKRLKYYTQGIVSPLYICFKMKDNIANASYLEQYFGANKFNSEILAIAQEGARNHGLLNMGIEDFFNCRIINPPLQEQEKIAEIFSCCDKVIELKAKLLKKENANKKSLVKLLLDKNSIFNQTDLNYKTYKFQEVIEKVSSKSYQINSSEYLSEGKYPVVDQGKTKIIAYSNLSDKLFSCPNEGVIIFGDHTREVKFIDFDFIIGADGTQILKSKDKFNTKYIFYCICEYKIPNTGYNRHYKFLKEMKFVLPTIEKQTQIVKILSKYDKKIELLQQELEQYKQLKKSLSQLLLTGIVRTME